MFSINGCRTDKCHSCTSRNASDHVKKMLRMGTQDDASYILAKFKPVSIKDGFLFSAATRGDCLIHDFSDQDYIPTCVESI